LVTSSRRFASLETEGNAYVLIWDAGCQVRIIVEAPALKVVLRRA
jgi:hypothetical protein